MLFKTESNILLLSRSPDFVSDVLPRVLDTFGSWEWLFLFVLKYVLSTCKTLFLESCTASTTMFSLLIPYLAPFFSIFHPRHQITGGNITYIHSTHTPLARRDEITITMKFVQNDFYSHASCEARHICLVSSDNDNPISTHTPHAGRDQHFMLLHTRSIHFYSHAPCGARPLRRKNSWTVSNFYSHAPCGARQNFSLRHRHFSHFYSHAPCEARRHSLTACSDRGIFLLTLPMRGATGTVVIHTLVIRISTHTPLARRDNLQPYETVYYWKFLLTRLLRGATKDKEHGGNEMKFLLTRLLRGATRNKDCAKSYTSISTHTPLARRDPRKKTG